MVPFTHSNKITSYGNVTEQQKETRMQEIIDCIQNTLNYPHTGFLYIFYQDPLLIPYMEKQNLNHKEKITFVPNMIDTIATLFHYAHENLQGEIVMLTNADTYPVEGFEKVNLANLTNNKIAYLISRYSDHIFQMCWWWSL